MTNEANDILAQARNGSVAAIIQILNEKLTDSGVRTRAIFADGMLQLLCEGQTLDQLEQPVLVERIRYLLENIAPRNIRRVNIYSRIVREQQLLWLDEINRDPQGQVLWSEQITLKQPSFLKRVQADWAARQYTAANSDRGKSNSPKSATQKLREKRQFQRGLIGGALLGVILLLGGWWAYQRYLTENLANASNADPAPTPTPAAIASPQPSVTAAPVSPTVDPFVEAVRLAEQTVQASTTAQSAADWLRLATNWQRASELMAQVPNTDARYQTAQDRVISYRRNSEVSLEKAKQP